MPTNDLHGRFWIAFCYWHFSVANHVLPIAIYAFDCMYYHTTEFNMTHNLLASGYTNLWDRVVAYTAETLAPDSKACQAHVGYVSPPKSGTLCYDLDSPFDIGLRKQKADYE